MLSNIKLHYHFTFRQITSDEMALAKVSIWIALVFIPCHAVRWIPNIYELLERVLSKGSDIRWPFWLESITYISHFSTVLNSSVNFYIYYFTSHRAAKNSPQHGKEKTQEYSLQELQSEMPVINAPTDL